ncbi:MAG: hypothetical protein IKT65_01010 [Clostridia bacterium]|nr:hypothetical protein [Clostridia bacterium]
MKNRIFSIIAVLSLFIGCCSYVINAVTISPNDDGVYEISSYGQLRLFSDLINGKGIYSSSGAVKNADAVLVADIVANEGLLNDDGSIALDDPDVWTPMYNFSGVFDGNGHSITGLYFDEYKADAGLFSVLAENSQVKNLNIKGSYICGKTNVGMIAGSSYGDIINCTSDGNVTSYACTSGVGGIVGVTYGNVMNCKNYSYILSISGTIEGKYVDYAAGIAGISYGKVEKCINEGYVTAAEASAGGICGIGTVVTDCYNTSSVSGIIDVGGICTMLKGRMENCYNIGEIYADAVQGSNVGAIVGVCDVSDDNGSYPENNYYLTTEISGIGSYVLPDGSLVESEEEDSGAEMKSSESFENGNVAHLLGKSYGMLIGKDKYPVFNDGSNTVYMVAGVACSGGGRVLGINEYGYTNGGALAVADDGYAFAGWYDNNGVIENNAEISIQKVSESTVLKALFAEKGDVNCDGVKNSKDIIKYKKFFAGKAEIYNGIGDVDNDGDTDTDDIALVVADILQ